jgi:hypothetical protein
MSVHISLHVPAIGQIQLRLPQRRDVRALDPTVLERPHGLREESRGISDDDIARGCPLDLTRWPVSQGRDIDGRQASIEELSPESFHAAFFVLRFIVQENSGMRDRRQEGVWGGYDKKIDPAMALSYMTDDDVQ